MERVKQKIAVIGGGSWATAIVKILTNNHSPIYWWVREPEIKEGVELNGRNPLFLSSALLNNKKIRISNNLRRVVSRANIIILVVPSAYIYKSLEVLTPKHFKNKIIVSAIKGIVPEKMLTVTQYIHSQFDVAEENMCVVCGPSHAEEIAAERLTYLTAGSSNTALANTIADIFRCKYVHINTSSDMKGIEFSVILKNIYAMGGGMFRGAGFGDNLLATFNANCINEMTHFLNLVVPNEQRSFYSAPYLGDFLVTSYSQYSRNRQFGMMIGRGYSVRTAQLEMKMIAEGYYAVKCIHEICKSYDVNIPIIEMVYRILYENSSIKLEFIKMLDVMK
ncbi:MAG: NAD(P)-binding domain-containing protein [Bacteroidales bacterium]|nr:NAD(P)-binding domain-containing protein [Bacteroidales bacterium]